MSANLNRPQICPGLLTEADLSGDLPVPPLSRWDDVREDMPAIPCKRGHCDQCDAGAECPTAAQRPYDEPGPRWFTAIENRWLLVALAMATLGAIPYFWKS